MTSASRIRSNEWLSNVCKDIPGRVLSIGSARDGDNQGGRYRDYFTKASEYTTSEVSQELAEEYKCDAVIDVCDIDFRDGEFDCVFCSGVLEHVFDFRRGLSEITRILSIGGILLLGLPFRQAIHDAPHDYWRFTRFAIQGLLKDYSSVDIVDIDPKKRDEFPATYWTRAVK